MPRSPFQVLLFPFRTGEDGRSEYAVFRRSDMKVWQGLAGGGEASETPEEAARREALEEAGLPPDSALLQLDSTASIPSFHFAAAAEWGPEVTEIPEYAFGLAASSEAIKISSEHLEFAWLPYSEAVARLEWESNRQALCELNERLTGTRNQDQCTE